MAEDAKKEEPQPQPLFAAAGGPLVWVPKEDVYEELPDGRVLHLAHAGKGIPWGEALAQGLTKEQPQLGPSEIKDLHEGKIHVGSPPVSAAKAAGAAPSGAERMAPGPDGPVVPDAPGPKK